MFILVAVMVLCGLGLTANTAQADLTCHAELDRLQVARHDQLVLTVVAEGDAGWSADFTLPELEDVRVQGGGTNQSMVYSDGKTVTTLSRTYYLQIDTDTDFTIGPVEIRSGGEVCRTEPIAVKVRPAGAATGGVAPGLSGNRTLPATPDQTTPNNVDSRRRARSPGGQPGDDIFVTVEVDHDDAWVGQQIILSFHYYRRVQPWNNPSYQAPRAEGFWREALGPEREFRRVVAGRSYNVTEIRYALFPTRAGALTIDPAELTFREDVFDRFFNSRRRTGPRVFRTDPLTVTVKALPQPAPAEFKGLVATQVDLQVTTDKAAVPRGEPVGWNIKLVSDGFLKGFDGLQVPLVTGARVHDAGDEFRTTIGQQKLVSELAVNKVLVPSQEGELEIPDVAVAWFDARTGRYRTAHGAVGKIRVLASDLPLEGDESSGFLRSEIARLGSDLAFVHQPGSRLRTGAALAAGSALWWGLLLVPVLLLAAWRIFLNSLAAQRRDPAGQRRRRALSVAKKQLQTAMALDEETARLAAAARVITDFVAAVTDRPDAAVDAVEVRSFCRGLGHSDLGDWFTSVLAACDTARYGGGTAAVDASDLGSRVADGLTVLARELAKGGRTTTSARNHRSPAKLALWASLLAIGGMTIDSSAAGAQPVQRPGVDPVRLVAEGNQAYTAGELDRARDLYEQAEANGVDDATVHFNLGNVHARQGELGLAVASYLRARRLNPRDDDTQENLAWVRSHIQDLELLGGSLPLFISQLYAFEESFTLGEWGALLIVSVWLLAGLLAWGWYRHEVTAALRRILLACGVFVAVVLVVTGWRYYREEIHNQAVVVADQVAVRSGPAETFATLFEIHDGLTVTLHAEQDSWARIGLGGAWQGWIPRQDLVLVRREPHSGR